MNWSRIRVGIKGILGFRAIASIGVSISSIDIVGSSGDVLDVDGALSLLEFCVVFARRASVLARPLSLSLPACIA